MASFLILSLVLTEAAAGLVLVKVVNVGETVTLNCSDSRTPIRAVEWIKEGRPPKNILFYSGGHLDPDHQHSTFKDRVELVDLQLKGGDLSLRLKDVVLSDAGTYQCLVAAGPSRRRKRAFIDGEPVRTIQLEVRGSANDNAMNDNAMNDNAMYDNAMNDNAMYDNAMNDNAMYDNAMNKPVLRPFVGMVAGFALLLVVVGAVMFRHGVYKRRLVKRSDEGEHSLEQQNPDSLP